MRDHRQVNADGLVEIRGAVDMRRNEVAGRHARQQTALRRRRNLGLDNRSDVGQFAERRPLVDRQITFRRRVPTQEHRFCGSLDADAAAGRAPQCGRQPLHLGAQPRRVHAHRQARTAADERSFVKNRLAGDIEHRESLPDPSGTLTLPRRQCDNGGD